MPAPFLTLSDLYLNVPFEEKDDAKEKGAKWDKDKKLWYAPTGHDPLDFAQWWAFLNPVFKDKEQIKDKGAKWVPEIKKWIVPSSLDYDDFHEWWPKDLKQYIFNERFICQGPVEEGGQSTVFKAWDLSEDRYCAVKLYNKEIGTSDQSSEAFKREMDSLLKLDGHKNILQLIDWGVHERSGQKFMVTPWMKYTLHQLLGDQENVLRLIYNDFSPEPNKADEDKFVFESLNEIKSEDPWFAAYGEDLHSILDGLLHAYKKKVLHRDLKPGNIFIEQSTDSNDEDDFFNYRLGDFGAAKNWDEDTSNMTVANLWSEPWQPNPNNADEHLFQSTWDVYAWGVIALALVTDEIPETIEDVHKLLNGSFKEKVGENLHTYFCKILNKDADKRPANVKILKRNIDKLNKERRIALKNASFRK